MKSIKKLFFLPALLFCLFITSNSFAQEVSKKQITVTFSDELTSSDKEFINSILNSRQDVIKFYANKNYLAIAVTPQFNESALKLSLDKKFSRYNVQSKAVSAKEKKETVPTGKSNLNK